MVQFIRVHTKTQGATRGKAAGTLKKEKGILAQKDGKAQLIYIRDWRQ